MCRCLAAEGRPCSYPTSSGNALELRPLRCSDQQTHSPHQPWLPPTPSCSWREEEALCNRATFPLPHPFSGQQPQPWRKLVNLC